MDPKHLRRPARGQSLVELAMLLPLLLMMIMAMTDFALAFTTQTRLRNAVAEGGYVAAQNPGNEDIVRAQIREALQGLNPPIEDADIAIDPCVRQSGEYNTAISVAYERPLLFGLFGAGPSVTLRDQTTVPQFGACS
jgi:Flp pilus assembly protein TadG